MNWKKKYDYHPSGSDPKEIGRSFDAVVLCWQNLGDWRIEKLQIVAPPATPHSNCLPAYDGSNLSETMLQNLPARQILVRSCSGSVPDAVY